MQTIQPGTITAAGFTTSGSITVGGMLMTLI